MAATGKKTRDGHFSPALFAFLEDLAANNERDWFNANKSRYLEHARDPMLAFIADFAPRLGKISPHFVADPRPQGGSMHRIYRDLRFSKDKTPYKTAVSARFRHERGRHVSAPGFYLHIGLDGAFAGAGHWRPDPPALKRIRHFIVDNPAEWRRVRRLKALRSNVSWHGQSLARPPRGFDAGHEHVEDLKRRDFVVFRTFDRAAVTAPGFLSAWVAHCRSVAPLVRYLTDAQDLDW